MPEKEPVEILPLNRLERRPLIQVFRDAQNGHLKPTLGTPEGLSPLQPLEMRPRIVTYQEELQKNGNH